MTAYEYDRNGNLITQSRPDGTVENYTYDKAGNRIRQTDKKGDTVIQDIAYEYDDAGNITAITEYNRKESVLSVTGTVMTYDKANRLVSYNNEAVEYDADGNMAYGPLDGVMTEFTYDCRNRLVKAGDTTCEYDAENKRISVVDGTTRTEYMVENNATSLSQILVETEYDITDKENDTGEVTCYIYGNGLLAQENEKDGYLTYHYNNTGSTTAITDESGERIRTYTYGEYGNLLTGDTEGITFLYNGKYGVITSQENLRWTNTEIILIMTILTNQRKDSINGKRSMNGSVELGDKKLGIYVHIPFCVKKCRYCDFLSAPCDEAGKEEYVNALIREIQESAADFSEYQVDTVFVGGGTPSILEAGQMKRILETVRENYNLERYTECTMECNPGTMTGQKAEAWLEAGVNRLSLGLQSANDNELRALGRIHTVEEFLDSYLLARNCGFQNINVDLMNALPYQTLDSFCATLRSVAGLAPEHISVYSLIVEENTPLYEWVHSGNEGALPDEEVERKMYYSAKSILAEYGYERYEISNYAKKGYECRHNIGYWERKEYAGFGLGAASLVGNVRYNNLSDQKSYMECAGSRKENEEILSKEDEMAEFMFLGLRKIAGISKEKFYDTFGMAYDEVYGNVTRELTKKGLIHEEGDTVRLTEFGIDVSNVVMAEFLPE